MDDSSRFDASLSDASGAGTLSQIREALSCVKFLCATGDHDRAGLRFAADALTQLEQEGELIDRFRIVRELGAGGFGRVFLAEDLRLQRLVAIKVPLPRVLAQPRLSELFAAEPLVAAGLDHAGIVPVFDGGQAGVVPYLVSGYVDGPPLDVWLAEQARPVDADNAARLVSQLADAVGHAHERGVLHLDLKPANVLLDMRRDAYGVEQLFPRLTDFGLARRLRHEDSLSVDADARGTVAYMAPEQSSLLAGAVTVRSDVYGLGAILWELLTGKPLAQQRHAHALQRLRADISPDLAAIVARCLESEPARRYASATALATDLRRFLAREFVEARSPRHLERWSRRARRHPVAWSLVAALVTTALTGVASVVFQWRRAEAHLATSQQETRRANANLSDAEAAIVALSQAVEDGNFATTLLGLPGSASNDALTRLHDHALHQERGSEQSLEFLATTASRQASAHSLQGDDVAAEAGYRQAFDAWRRAMLAEAQRIEINRSAVHCAYAYELHQRKANDGQKPTKYVEGGRILGVLNAEEELDAAWLEAYAAMLENRSGILRQFERFPEAEWHADSAASICRVLRTVNNGDERNLLSEARALHQRALAQSRQLEYERAVASWQSAIELIEGTHGASPVDREVARWLAKLKAGYVRHVWNRGSLRHVRKEADQARTILDALVASTMSDELSTASPEEVLDLADMQFACGDICEMEHRLGDAVALWRPALEHFNAYYSHHIPQPAERLRCARLAFQLAQANRSLGQNDDAEVTYLRAVEWVRPIFVRRAPREDVVKLMAACYDARGDIAWNSGRMVAAAKAHDEVVGVHQINASARRFDNDARRAERQARQARRDRVGGD